MEPGWSMNVDLQKPKTEKAAAGEGKLVTPPPKGLGKPLEGPHSKKGASVVNKPQAPVADVTQVKAAAKPMVEKVAKVANVQKEEKYSVAAPDGGFVSSSQKAIKDEKKVSKVAPVAAKPKVSGKSPVAKVAPVKEGYSVPKADGGYGTSHTPNVKKTLTKLMKNVKKKGPDSIQVAEREAESDIVDTVSLWKTEIEAGQVSRSTEMPLVEASAPTKKKKVHKSREDQIEEKAAQEEAAAQAQKPSQDSLQAVKNMFAKLSSPEEHVAPKPSVKVAPKVVNKKTRHRLGEGNARAWKSSKLLAERRSLLGDIKKLEGRLHDKPFASPSLYVKMKAKRERVVAINHQLGVVTVW